jgi:hypothetical protein
MTDAAAVEELALRHRADEAAQARGLDHELLDMALMLGRDAWRGVLLGLVRAAWVAAAIDIAEHIGGGGVALRVWRSSGRAKEFSGGTLDEALVAALEAAPR